MLVFHKKGTSILSLYLTWLTIIFFFIVQCIQFLI
uniref:Uncharacterized protein n=1 Tax=Setaria italica TaxID=4555 RepID=K3ZPB0_SETIT